MDEEGVEVEEVVEELLIHIVADYILAITNNDEEGGAQKVHQRYHHQDS